MADYSSRGAQAQAEEDRRVQQAEQDRMAADHDFAGGQLGDIQRAEWAKQGRLNDTGHAVGRDVYQNPGSHDYGGEGGVEHYKKWAMEGAAQNDAAQKANSGALAGSIAAMKGADARGPMAIENKLLAEREAMTRGQQIDAVGLARDAAMGKAPSEAEFQTRIGMNDTMAQHAGNMGGARGLAGLGGAQLGSAAVGQASGNMAMQGGLARSKEIGEALGLYGGLSGQTRGQDLTRLGVSNQNARFNQGLNDDWKIGNANNAIAQGRLGVGQGQLDAGWYDEAMKPEEIQFRYDQELAAEQAGASIDRAGALVAKDKDKRANTQQIVGGATQGTLTAIGSLGGPAGAAAGGMGGTAINAATARYY